MYFTDPKAKFGGRGWRERPLVIAPPQNRSLHLSLSLSPTTTCSVYPHYSSVCLFRDNKQSRANPESSRACQLPISDLSLY